MRPQALDPANPTTGLEEVAACKGYEEGDCGLAGEGAEWRRPDSPSVLADAPPTAAHQQRIEAARIKVEAVMGEDQMVDLLEVLELFCELLLARFGLLETGR